MNSNEEMAVIAIQTVTKDLDMNNVHDIDKILDTAKKIYNFLVDRPRYHISDEATKLE